MNKSPAFQFYWSDFYNSPKVQLMSLEAEAAYKRLLCFQWDEGYIPSDVKQLARICKNIPVKRMVVIWPQLDACFQESGIDGQLFNPRMKLLRDERIAFLAERSSSGKKGAAERWKEDGKTIAEPMAEPSKKNASPSPSPSPSQKGEKKGNKQGDSPATEKRAGRADLAADLFSDSYLTHKKNPYGFLKADFVQLAALRHRLGIDKDGTPDLWSEALLNYFASPFDNYSLKYFCSKFDTFKDSPLDRFGKPVNHLGGYHVPTRPTENDKNNGAIADFIARSLAPEVRSDVPDVREEPERLPGSVRLLS